MATRYASFDLLGLRVSQLTAGGAPVTGANHGYVTEAAIKLDIGLNIEAGTEVTQKNGSGAICATRKGIDRIKNVTLSMDLCQLDSQLIGFLTGGDVFVSGGRAIGGQIPASDAPEPNGVCLEVWTRAWDVEEQAVSPFTTPLATYWHWVFPSAKFTEGQTSLVEGVSVIPVTGTGTANSHITSNGPYDDWPTAIRNAGGITNAVGWFEDSNLPDFTTGLITVTSAAS